MGAGTVVAVAGLVHARTVLPDEFFVPPYTLAIGDPVRLLAPGDPDVPQAIGRLGFAEVAFGAAPSDGDRLARYERIAEVRVNEFAAHLEDRPASD